MKRILMLLTLLSLLLQPTVAQGHDASGTWRSSSGNTFYIPASSKYFDLIITTSSGQRYVGQGQWVQTGHSFTYTVSGMPGSAYVTYSPKYDALKVQGPNGTSWWRRV